MMSSCELLFSPGSFVYWELSSEASLKSCANVREFWEGEEGWVLQDFWVLLLPPLFKWWCRFKCDSSLMGLVSGGTCVSALFQSAQKLPSRVAVCQEVAVNYLFAVWPAGRTAAAGCPCEVKCVQGVLWRSVDLDRLGACRCQRANRPHTTAGEWEVQLCADFWESWMYLCIH